MTLDPVLRQQIRSAIDAAARKQQASDRRVTYRIHDLELLIALGRLGDDEREVWVDRFVVGRTLEGIALDMGIKRERVRQIEKNALRKLKTLLPEAFVARWSDDDPTDKEAAA